MNLSTSSQKLYPFQIEGAAKTVRFLRERGCCYNGSEMGTGKTVMTLRAIEEISSCEHPLHVLVICPAIATLVWEMEWYKWADHRKYLGCPKILSYDKASRENYKKVLLKPLVPYDVLVLDEAHYVKNPEAARTKAVLEEIWPTIKYKICLSGTPFTQSIMDCWPVFSRMNPEDFSDYWEFVKSYTKVVRIPYGPRYKFEGVKNAEKLKKIINDKFFFRYTKEKVLKELPGKTYQLIPLGPEYKVPTTPDQEKEQERYLELLKKSFATGQPAPKPPIPIATRAREQGLKKIPAIVEFARNLLDAETPIIIFCYHTEVIEKLKEELKSYGPVSIYGKTPDAERKRAVEQFQSGESNCFIGQFKAAGTSITLTRSSTVILGEMSWSPSDVSQAIDRADRIGQESLVTVYYFAVAASVDEKFQEVLMQKSKAFKKVIG